MSDATKLDSENQPQRTVKGGRFTIILMAIVWIALFGFGLYIKAIS